jgi:hypothetical protein
VNTFTKILSAVIITAIIAVVVKKGSQVPAMFTAGSTFFAQLITTATGIGSSAGNESSPQNFSGGTTGSGYAENSPTDFSGGTTGAAFSSVNSINNAAGSLTKLSANVGPLFSDLGVG